MGVWLYRRLLHRRVALGSSESARAGGAREVELLHGLFRKRGCLPAGRALPARSAATPARPNEVRKLLRMVQRVPDRCFPQPGRGAAYPAHHDLAGQVAETTPCLRRRRESWLVVVTRCAAFPAKTRSLRPQTRTGWSWPSPTALARRLAARSAPILP